MREMPVKMRQMKDRTESSFSLFGNLIGIFLTNGESRMADIEAEKGLSSGAAHAGLSIMFPFQGVKVRNPVQVA